MTINTTDIRLLIKSVRGVVLERVQCELFTGGLHAHVLMHMYVFMHVFRNYVLLS